MKDGKSINSKLLNGNIMIKNGICAIVAILCAILLHSNVVSAATAFFEIKTEETLTKGVTYQSIRQATDSGLRDIYILRIPLNDPNIVVNEVSSQKEYGLKETVSTLLKDNGAIAGVNADFFGLNGNYSLSFGPVFKDGKMVSVATGTNAEKNEHAAFFIDKEKNPFIMYLKTEIEFLNDGKKNITVVSINKVTDMVFPIIVNRQAMMDTKDLDARFTGLLKVVVDDGEVIQVSQKGETVEIPRNGYVLVISEASADYFGQFYKVGQTAEIRYTAGIDFTKIQTAVGGGGRILLDGEIVHDYGISSTARQPRTTLGITKDKRTLILLVVDGRTHSIGATHNEIGELLKKYGAYNAMNLDGGGSTTMAVQKPFESDMKVVNTLSDGSQRRVINALGIFNESPVGKMDKVLIKTETQKLLKGVPVKIEYYGVDTYLNKLNLAERRFRVTTNDPGGEWKDGYYIPGRSGDIRFKVTRGRFSTELTLPCTELVELRPSVKNVRIGKGEQVTLKFNGIDNEGNQMFIGAGVQYTVSPKSLGTMKNSIFTASGSGNGYIKCTVGNISAYVEVQIGSKEVTMDKFESGNTLLFSGYPSEYVNGAASYSSEEKMQGSKSAQMHYNFSALEETQAAYMVFQNPINLPEDPVALKLDVLGNESNLWLRAKIRDGNDKEITIDFAKVVDWEGWKTVLATLPADVKYPVKLERVYLAAVSLSEPLSGNLFIDNLIGICPVDTGKVQLLQSPVYQDPMKASLNGNPSEGSFDIVLIGDVLPGAAANPAAVQAANAKVMAQIQKNARRVLYAGETDYPVDIGVGVYQWNTSYMMHTQDNVSIVHLTAAKGGISATNASQWKFAGDIDRNGKDNIIIVIDKNPQNFNQSKEFELFHDILVNLKKAGKNIFVVSTDGRQSTSTIRDGIRYMNAAPLWNNGNTINADFTMLRFRISGKRVRYDFQALNN